MTNFPSLAEVVLSPVEEIRAKSKTFADTMWKRYGLKGSFYAEEYLANEVSQLLQEHEMTILRRNAPPMPEARIELPFARTDDPEITCIYCRMPGVEYSLTVRRPGERALIGLHERCRRSTQDQSADEQEKKGQGA